MTHTKSIIVAVVIVLVTYVIIAVGLSRALQKVVTTQENRTREVLEKYMEDSINL